MTVHRLVRLKACTKSTVAVAFLDAVETDAYVGHSVLTGTGAENSDE